MAKRSTVLIAVLTLALVVVVPALAQEESDKSEPVGTSPPVPASAQEGANQDEAANTLPPVPPGYERVAWTFELTVEGDTPEEVAFFGRTIAPAGAGAGASDVPLTDPDGDGIYTGSDFGYLVPGSDTPNFVNAPPTLQIVQGTGPQARVIKDFGVVPLNEDKTFSASVSFEDGQQPRPGEEVTTTGVLRESGANCNECAKHAVTDETSGTTYYLLSDPQSPFEDYVDLDSYVDQRVTVSGILQMQGQNNLQVTSIEPVDAPGEEVSATGTIERLGAGPVVIDGLRICETSTHAMTDEATGRYHDLKSDAVDLESYVGERVTIYGKPLVSPAVVGAERCPDFDVTRVERAGAPDELVTATFELTTEGKPPADATFFAIGVADPRIEDLYPAQQLKDPDGDGLYSAEAETIPGDYPLKIVQGTETKSCGEFGGACPGEPSNTIKDFGTVNIEDDETFSASISFKDNKGGTTTPSPGNGGPGNGGPGNGGFFGGGSGSGGIRGFLPSTGGMALTVLGVGALLVGGGLLIRRLAR